MLDPEGNVVAHGEGGGPENIQRLRHDSDLISRLRETGQGHFIDDTGGRPKIKRGYFRTVDALVVVGDDAELVESIRSGRTSARGHVIALDAKFGKGGVLRRTKDLVRRLGIRPLAVRPGGSVTDSVRRIAGRFASSARSAAGFLSRIGNSLGMLSFAVEVSEIPAKAKSMASSITDPAFEREEQLQRVTSDIFEEAGVGVSRGLHPRDSDPDPFGP